MPTKTLILPGHEDRDAMLQTDFARVTIDEKYANLLLRRISWAKFLDYTEPHGVTTIRFFDSSCEFFGESHEGPWNQDDQEWLTTLIDEEEEYALLDEPPEIPDYALQRDECWRCVVTRDHIHWEAIAKHTNVTIYTDTLYAEILTQILGEVLGKPPESLSLGFHGLLGPLNRFLSWKRSRERVRSQKRQQKGGAAPCQNV